jgi:histidine triad (HIT) family protein
MPCLFCKIIAGEIPSKKVFEDDLSYAFKDINPQAPVHVLVVPRKHIASLAEAGIEDQELIGHLHLVAAGIASSEGLSNGYRTVINTGNDGGQTVDHLHVHLLGGRAIGWPPG